MKHSVAKWETLRKFFLFSIVIGAIASLSNGACAAAAGRIALQSHTAAELTGMVATGQVAASKTVPLTIALPLPNRAGLAAAIAQMYDPKSPQYHHFLTPVTFAAEYGPSSAAYNAVIQWARSNGLTVTRTFTSRLILDVAGPASAVEQAFNVHLSTYTVNGRTVQVPDVTPTVPSSIASDILGVLGIDTLNAAVSNAIKADPLAPAVVSPQGSGPYGGLAPVDINGAYNIAPLGMDGSGQTIALYEMDQYYSSDILAYEQHFGITHADVESVPVNNFADPPSSEDGQGEVTLDIELMLAVAPRAKILVYQGENPVDFWNIWEAIADDNRAQSVSTSWAQPEELNSDTETDESEIYMQLAAQGQTLYAASGDAGAYYYESWTFDPATDPYVCGVGGTTLTLNGTSYGSETTWSDSGGGLSSYWSVPSYQTGQGSSTTWRNVPDVSLDADPETGYAVYLNGSWGIWGGTSCAAPLWGAYTSLVDEELTAESQSTLGEINPIIYPIGEGSNYHDDFHDITSGNNGHYSAVAGYDDATGWGTINGVNLFTDLTGYSSSAAPGIPQGLVATGSPSTVTLAWGNIYGATSYNVYRGTSSGGESSTPIRTGLTSPAYSDTSVTNNATYYYKVAAVNANGTGAKSAEVSSMPGAIPFAPTSLAESVASNQVTLTWTSSLGDSTFNVYRGNASGAEAWAPIATGLSSPTYTDSNVENYITYYYTVAAVNPVSTSAQSNEVSATPGPRPEAPSDLTAEGGSNEVVLSWTASPYGATSYNVYRGTTSGGESATPVATGVTAATYTDTSAANGNTYYYKVAAVNAYGSSTMTNEASATTGLPSAPTGLAAAANGSNAIDLTWSSAAGGASFNVYRSSFSGGPYSQVGTSSTASYTDGSVRPGTLYYYEVAAVAGNYVTPKSADASAETTPAAPTDLHTAVDGDTVKLTWTASTGATSYTVERSSTSGSGYSPIGTSTSPAHTDSGIGGGSTYYYVVTAVDAGGASAVSNQASISTVASAPAGLTATSASSSEIDLAWSASASATSYSICRGLTESGPFERVGTTSSTSYANVGLAAGTVYYYEVIAVNPGGNSPASNVADATTMSGAPTGLRAVADGSSTIDLTWTAVKGATGYIILNSTTSGGSYNQVGTSSTPAFTSSGLTAATTYYYVVESANNAGDSAQSSQVSATTTPAAPSGLTVTGETGTSISLSWNASTGATGYTISRGSSASGPFTRISAVDSGTTTDVCGGLTPDTTYYFTVTANDDGGVSAASSAVSGTTLAGTPTGVRATALSGTSIKIAWTAARGAGSYEVLDSTTSGGPYNLAGSSTIPTFTATGLDSATTYYFVVEGVDAGGDSPYSNEVSATTLPGAPSGLQAATASSSEIDLTWTASTGASSYNVYRAASASGPYLRVGNTDTTSYSAVGLTAGTTYYFEVAAVDSGGTGTATSDVGATTLPATPTDVRAVASGSIMVDLTWNAAKGATQYNVMSSMVADGPYTQVGSVSTLKYAVTGLTPGTEYYFVVVATGPGGTSSDSNQATATTGPAAPTDVAAIAASSSEIDLSWDASTGAGSYTIWRSLNPGGEFTRLGATSDTTFANTGLSGGITYYYYVTATGSGITSGDSSTVSATTEASAVKAR